VITELTDLPAGVIGVETSGKLHAEDYRDVLLPAIERAAASGEVRVVIVIGSFDGMTASALWQDLKIGVQHLHTYKRIALVTDIEWMTNLTALFGWMTPGELKHFPSSQRTEAIAWAAGDQA
jgi:SpoIIAA-like